MLTWAQEHVPRWMRDNLDYVLVSYYADDCPGLDATPETFAAMFDKLAGIFPHARVGFGEMGTKCKDKESSENCIARKDQYIRHYYDILDRQIREKMQYPSRYIGGYFYWYYAEDMVPHPPSHTPPLFDVLASAMQSSQQPEGALR